MTATAEPIEGQKLSVLAVSQSYKVELSIENDNGMYCFLDQLSPVDVSWAVFHYLYAAWTAAPIPDDTSPELDLSRLASCISCVWMALDTIVGLDSNETRNVHTLTETEHSNQFVLQWNMLQWEEHCYVRMNVTAVLNVPVHAAPDALVEGQRYYNVSGNVFTDKVV